MIKNLMLGSGLILYPGLFFRNNNEQTVHFIIIGTQCTSFVEDYIISNPHINCTGIGNEAGISFLEDDFLYTNMQFVKFDYPFGKIPENIRNIFSAQNKYIIISRIYRPYSVLSKSIIEYLQNNSIDFRFLGITPLFNNTLGIWGKNYFKELMKDSRLSIFDVNEYIHQLQQINSKILARDGFKMLNDELTNSFIGFNR